MIGLRIEVEKEFLKDEQQFREKQTPGRGFSERQGDLFWTYLAREKYS